MDPFLIVVRSMLVVIFFCSAPSLKIYIDIRIVVLISVPRVHNLSHLGSW